mgnify:CR=1 FL=1
MASGKEHDHSTILFSLPFGLGIALLTDLKAGLIAAIAFLFGGLWLSPDLDTKSNSLKRWGILKFIWFPYQKLVPHRSILSHAPFLGTILRIAYLISLLCLALAATQFLKIPILLPKAMHLFEQAITRPKYYLIGIIGVEASAWLHILKDGDPLPSKWRNRGQK